MPTGLYALGQQASIHSSKANPGLYTVGVNVFINNHSDNTYKVQNYFTESMHPVIDETSEFYFTLFATMGGLRMSV